MNAGQPDGASTPGPEPARPTDQNARHWQASPWVVECRGRISYQIQPTPTLEEPAPIQRALATAQLAEELGFDAVSFGDHPAMLDCWVWLAAVATRSRHIRIGTGVACAAYRAPRATARLATDLDHLSGGRLVLGLGSGWVPQEFEMLGVPFGTRSERAARLAETLAVVTDLWGPAAASVLGEHYTPRQQPRPPVMVAGGGLQTLRLVAQYADACNIGPSPASGGAATPEQVAAKLVMLRRYCEAIGRPYEHVLRTYFVPSLVLARDEAGVRARREHYGGHPFIRPEHVCTPAEAVSRFQALADIGIEYFLVQLLDVSDHETIRLLAEHVVPHIQINVQLE
jgi:alkanesulfonate monooxygenase SsuD/methylene tetrahydromethanopterin reductase-like flavin-dependent oxidoreductase (luciferase family)